MTARDELPEGWVMTRGELASFIASNGNGFGCTSACATQFDAIAAAWRIVDAEQEKCGE